MNWIEQTKQIKNLDVFSAFDSDSTFFVCLSFGFLGILRVRQK